MFCELCDKAFKNKTEVYLHKQQKHNDVVSDVQEKPKRGRPKKKKAFKCKLCEYTSDKSSKLIRHIGLKHNIEFVNDNSITESDGKNKIRNDESTKEESSSDDVIDIDSIGEDYDESNEIYLNEEDDDSETMESFEFDNMAIPLDEYEEKKVEETVRT